MLLSIDPNDSRPVFRQITDEVQRCVAVGVLKPGEPLPGVRSLAAELKVNANTVQHAYRTMEQEGIVYVKRGIGTFIAAGAAKCLRHGRASSPDSSRNGRFAKRIAMVYWPAI